MTYDEAIAAISGAGQPFEVIEETVDGVTNRVFKNAPNSLRDVFAPARIDESIFLVYEDEEWSYKKVMESVDALAYALVHHFGIKKGDRVGVAMRNLPEWIISFAAITSVGAISPLTRGGRKMRWSMPSMTPDSPC